MPVGSGTARSTNGSPSTRTDRSRRSSNGARRSASIDPTVPTDLEGSARRARDQFGWSGADVAEPAPQKLRSVGRSLMGISVVVIDAPENAISNRLPVLSKP